MDIFKLFLLFALGVLSLEQVMVSSSGLKTRWKQRFSKKFSGVSHKKFNKLEGTGGGWRSPAKLRGYGSKKQNLNKLFNTESYKFGKNKLITSAKGKTGYSSKISKGGKKQAKMGYSGYGSQSKTKYGGSRAFSKNGASGFNKNGYGGGFPSYAQPQRPQKLQNYMSGRMPKFGSRKSQYSTQYSSPPGRFSHRRFNQANYQTPYGNRRNEYLTHPNGLLTSALALPLLSALHRPTPASGPLPQALSYASNLAPAPAKLVKQSEVEQGSSHASTSQAPTPAKLVKQDEIGPKQSSPADTTGAALDSENNYDYEESTSR